MPHHFIISYPIELLRAVALARLVKMDTRRPAQIALLSEIGSKMGFAPRTPKHFSLVGFVFPLNIWRHASYTE
jgi:hypothetical protein